MYQHTHGCIHRVCNPQLQFWWSGWGIRYTWSTSNDWLSVRHTLWFLHISGQSSHEIDFKFGECKHYETPMAWLIFCHAVLNHCSDYPLLWFNLSVEDMHLLMLYYPMNIASMLILLFSALSCFLRFTLPIIQGLLLFDVCTSVYTGCHGWF